MKKIKDRNCSWCRLRRLMTPSKAKTGGKQINWLRLGHYFNLIPRCVRAPFYPSVFRRGCNLCLRFVMPLWRTTRAATIGSGEWKKKEDNNIYGDREEKEKNSGEWGAPRAIFHEPRAYTVPEEFFILIFNTFSRSRLFLKTLLPSPAILY